MCGNDKKLPRESGGTNSHGARHTRPTGCVMSSLFIFLVVVLAMLCYAVFLFITSDVETPEHMSVARVAATAYATDAPTTTTYTSTSISTTKSTTTTTKGSEATSAAAPAVTTPATTRKARLRRRPMGKRPLLCTFGTYEQEYERIDIDGVCDFAFMPFYSRGRGDTFLDDGHPVVRKMLRLAVSARSTAYAISIPQRRVLLTD
ncbi:hypothetical protein HPB50_022842 [Hyalomma asiaticum]|uniref:Uncharacterized protein n=1 Tax=Hyalomma asiaticum TaxID=266040 RepID=A0ACB7SGE2_HYAAI|nr:hypothetical protein HPB50_022842 [Hyalomma asiaticum]